MTVRSLLGAALLLTTALPATAAVTFAGFLTVAGDAQDLSGQTPPGVNTTRLSYGSDLTYDAATQTYYGLTDRGPGGGFVSYNPRVEKFKLDLNSGAPSNFVLTETIVFRYADGTKFNGLNPLLLNGNVSTLGNSFDSEGLVRRSNGNLLVSDEYGPSVFEFTPDGVYIRAFTVPANLVPKQADNTVNYVGDRATVTKGRQDNRGFEGLTLSPDGTKAYAILQDPLFQEGPQSQGRRGQNLRIVEYDVASGVSTGQYVYQLDTIAALNASPLTDVPFTATQQGRSIGVSSITAIGNGKFLVIERDNRGIGVDNPTGVNPLSPDLADPVSKRVYLIDLAGATNIGETALSSTSNTLPAGVVAVSKTLWVDMADQLIANGVTIAEKMEGLTLVRGADDSLTMLIVTDNDYSVTQNADGVQFNVCADFTGGGYSRTIPLGDSCPFGSALLPSYVYSFNVTGEQRQIAGVPEPTSWALMIGGFGLVGTALRRRRPVIGVA